VSRVIYEDLLGEHQAPAKGEVRWSQFYESFVRYYAGDPGGVSPVKSYPIQFVTRNERKARLDRERSA
jgi:hypothetical protein